jgi:hypothetical protein
LHSYRIEDSEVLRLAVAVGFYCSEVVLLLVFLGLGLMVSTAPMGHAGVATSLLWYVDEARRAFGASMIFMVLSGYIVSVAALLALFRARPLSLTHAVWITFLFVLHAAFFLFYLRGPAVPSSSVMLIAVGVACVIAAAAAQYVLWSKWLLPRGQV